MEFNLKATRFFLYFVKCNTTFKIIIELEIITIEFEFDDNFKNHIAFKMIKKTIILLLALLTQLMLNKC
jgi:hypothetical protein